MSVSVLKPNPDFQKNHSRYNFQMLTFLLFSFVFRKKFGKKYKKNFVIKGKVVHFCGKFEKDIIFFSEQTIDR